MCTQCSASLTNVGVCLFGVYMPREVRVLYSNFIKRKTDTYKNNIIIYGRFRHCGIGITRKKFYGKKKIIIF